MGELNLGPVKAHVKKVAQLINARFDPPSIGGFAQSGHIPGSDHYTGLALDVMLGGNKSLGQEIANWTQNKSSNLAVKYIIWNREIWDARNNGGWEAYSGASPHTNHVHISFTADSGPIDTDSELGEGGPGASLNPLDNLASTLKERGLRIVTFIAGALLIIVAMYMFIRTQRTRLWGL